MVSAHPLAWSCGRDSGLKGERSMSGKQSSGRSLLIYGISLALSLVGLAKITRAQSPDIREDMAQSLAARSLQDKDQGKKDDKKDEKKDEKKALSLKPDRKIAFTTDEGTWLSLDAAPDGKSLAFELLGDIYTLPIEGGKAKLIDGGISFDSQPRFSPDGQWIAFISDREGSDNIWIMHPDGSGAKQVSKDPSSEMASPSWDPSGKYIYVSKTHVGIGVQITKSKASPATPRNERLNDMGAVASPDGKYLYYAERRRDFSYNS